jgi:DNA-directed RNA polymerase subunit beta'
VLFNRILPEEIQFVNWVLEKGALKDLVAEVYEVCGESVTPDVADAIKDIGFDFATRSGYAGGLRHHGSCE